MSADSVVGGEPGTESSPESSPELGPPKLGPPKLGIDGLLARARDGLDRVTVEQAAREVAEQDALLVDIRPIAQRAEYGEVPGALVIDRNVLEWRLDPASSARLPVADSYQRRVLILCQEGYSSSLAAAALRDLGLSRATDVIGGFVAWRDAGLPTC